MKLITFIAPTTQTQLALPRQEAIVLLAIKHLGSATPEAIADRCIDTGLRTRQDPVRIVEYYVSDLRKRGLVYVTGEKRGAKRVLVTLDAIEEAAE